MIHFYDDICNHTFHFPAGVADRQIEVIIVNDLLMMSPVCIFFYLIQHRFKSSSTDVFCIHGFIVVCQNFITNFSLLLTSLTPIDLIALSFKKSSVEVLFSAIHLYQLVGWHVYMY